MSRGSFSMSQMWNGISEKYFRDSLVAKRSTLRETMVHPLRVWVAKYGSHLATGRPSLDSTVLAEAHKYHGNWYPGSLNCHNISWAAISTPVSLTVKFMCFTIHRVRKKFQVFFYLLQWIWRKTGVLLLVCLQILLSVLLLHQNINYAEQTSPCIRNGSILTACTISVLKNDTKCQYFIAFFFSNKLSSKLQNG